MKPKTIDALQKAGEILAKQLGEEGPVEMHFCQPKTACTICCEIYVDESGCDPCPNCGAGYFSQIFDDELSKVGQEYQTDKRYVPDEDDEYWWCGEFENNE